MRYRGIIGGLGRSATGSCSDEDDDLPDLSAATNCTPRDESLYPKFRKNPARNRCAVTLAIKLMASAGYNSTVAWDPDSGKLIPPGSDGINEAGLIFKGGK